MSVATPKQVQHSGLYRKLLMRRHLMQRHAVPGAAYVPFIGDGDIAVRLYTDRRIYGADLDADRVAIARDQLALAHAPPTRISIANCNDWPFPGLETRIAIADFDAYSYPYESFRSFWREAHKASPLVVFFTDGQGHPLKHIGHWRRPDGSSGTADRFRRRRIYNHYLVREIRPWFEAVIRPWRVLDLWRYKQADILYWGAAIERPTTKGNR